MFGRTKSTMGLDIGTRALKGLCLKKENGKVWLESFFFHDLSVSNEAYPETTLMESKLAALIEGGKLLNRDVCSVLDNSNVAHLEFVLPEMPETELEAAIGSEVEEQLNMSRDEISYDYLVAPFEEGGVKKQKVKAYWVRKDLVMKHLSVIEAAKLKPRALEPTVMAQFAMLEFNGYLKDGKKYIALDIGESHTSVTLLNRNSVLSTHNYPIGSGSVNTALKIALGCSYQEAETQKIATPIEFPSSGADRSGEIIHSAYFELFKNVKDSYEAAVGDSSSIESVLFLGGSSYAPQIDVALTKILGVPVVIVNPLQNIEIYRDKNTELGEQIAARSGYFASAVGLALRGLE